MEVVIKVYRVAKVPTEHLKGCVGLDKDVHPEGVMRALREQFGPLAHGIQVFWADLDQGAWDGESGPQSVGVFRTALVGVEVMGFNVTGRFPQAGVASADPLDPAAIHREDGMLAGELTRWGLLVDPDEFEWRVAYDIKGSMPA